MPRRPPPVARKVHSYTSDTWIRCCWFECERDGYELYKTVFCDHSSVYPCNHPIAVHVHFIFCRERHRQLFLHSPKEMGKLPPGYRLAI